MATTEAVDTKPPAEINVEDFLNLIAGMSRLLTGLGRLQPFSDADLGLAEWVALTALADKDGVNNKGLARSLGVTGQRANQVSKSLAGGGLITVGQSADDNRANEIKITETGKAKIDQVNAQLKPLLAGALQGKERSIASASKQIRIIMRILHAAKPDKERKKDKKGKKGKESGVTE